MGCLIYASIEVIWVSTSGPLKGYAYAPWGACVYIGVYLWVPTVFSGYTTAPTWVHIGNTPNTNE